MLVQENDLMYLQNQFTTKIIFTRLRTTYVAVSLVSNKIHANTPMDSKFQTHK